MDVLRLAITRNPVEAEGFQVEVWVNEVEMTSAGAGLGMDPFQILIPENRLVPTYRPTTVPIARCACGEYGCGSTDVTITDVGNGIQWEWRLEVPMDRPALFDRAAYLAEIERIAADRSWETRAATAARLVLTGIADRELPKGLSFDWVANSHRRASQLEVCLRHDGHTQVFLLFDWAKRTPEEMAAEVRRVLVDTRPQEWSARWSAITPDAGAPPMAGPRWRPYEW